MKEIELLTCEWALIPRDLRPDAIANARDRAGRLALTWSGDPDESTYVEHGLRGASRLDAARWSEKTPAILRADIRVCHYVDACVRAQAAFYRRKALPKSARKMVEWVKRTRANRGACRDILIDMHAGTPPYSLAGPVEREALRKMREAVRRENERAEMLLIAMAIYPAGQIQERASRPEVEELLFPSLPESTRGAESSQSLDAWPAPAW